MRRTLRGRRAFTLVELLVAMTVLVLMLVFMLALTNATNRATQISTRAIDASSQARLALDRIGVDLANLFQRPDVVFTASNSSATCLQFFTYVESAAESPVSSPVPNATWLSANVNRGLSVVAYQLAPATSNLSRLCLQRGARPFQTTDVGFMGLGTDGYPISSQTTPASTDFDVLAPGVINLVVGFQLYPDNLAVTLQDGSVPGVPSSSPVAQGQIVYSPPLRTDVGADSYVDLTRVSAIVVGVVAIDLQSLQLLNAKQVSALSAAFPIPTTKSSTNQLPAQLWEPLAANVASLPTKVPLPARQSVRVLQRFYPVANFARR